MIYIFAFLSVFSPAIFLQSRVLDTPLAPTIGALSLCFANACVVFPRLGTTLHAFVQTIPPSNTLAIDAPPQAGVLTPDGMEGDDGGGGGRCRCKGPQERSHGTQPLISASPTFLAPTLSRPNVEPFTWEMSPNRDIGSYASPFAYRRFTGTTYPIKAMQKPQPAIDPHAEPLPSNPALPQGLWSDRDRFLALASSGGLGRNGSTSVAVNGTGDHLAHGGPNPKESMLIVPQDMGNKLSGPPLFSRTGSLSRVGPVPNATEQSISTADLVDSIGPKVDLVSTSLAPSLDLSSSKDRYLPLRISGGLLRSWSVFSWGFRCIGHIFKWSFGHDGSKKQWITIASSAINRAAPGLPAPLHFALLTLPPSQTPKFPASPKSLASDKASNETRPYTATDKVTNDLSKVSPPIAIISNCYSFNLPWCRWSGENLRFLDGERMGSQHPSPPIKITAPQPQCMLADRTLHLLNETCISMSELPRPIAKAKSLTIDPIPFRPIRTFSLPCFDIISVLRGVNKNCGFYGPPSLDMALDWDIRSQATLLNSQAIDETPAFFTVVVNPDLPICSKCRGSGPGTKAHTTTSIGPLANPRLRSIRTRYTAAVTLATLKKVFCLGRWTKELQVCFALAATLFALGQVLSLAGLNVKIGRDSEEAPRANPKPKKTPVVTTRATTPPPVHVEEITTQVISVAEGDVPAPVTPKRTPSPIKKKARIIAGRRVQPARKSKISPPPSPTLAPESSPTGSGGKKGRKPKQTKRS